jgi:hypothetical protein
VEEQASVFNQATKKGLNPALRTLPPDYNEWLIANHLDPVEWDIEVEYDDQWMINHCAKHSVEHGSQKPSTDEKQQPKSMTKDGSDLTAVGELASSAASVLMKVMYGARMARPDLLRPVQALARFMTKWTRQQDLELHKLMCYIHTTKSWKTVGWVGDDIKDISTVIYSDADWAGSSDKFSTSGSFCCLKGQHTFFPLAARSKRQSTISSSTTEAELGAAQVSLQKQGVPIQVLWNTVVKAHGGDTAKMYVLLDNSPILEIIRTGRNLTMRHLSKTKGISVAWLHQICSPDDVHLRYISTSLMAADIFTKMFTDKIKWIYLCMLGGLFEHGPKNGVWSEALVAEKTHEQSLRTILFGTHRPGGPDDTLMPPGISTQFKGYGWHQDESRMILVCREPRMYRIPEDASLTLRTTWLRTTTGWVQFEDRIPWAQQNPRTPKFAVWGDRGVFVFESGTKLNPKLSAKATPVITQDPGLEHGSPRDNRPKPSPEDEWESLWDETRKAK